MNNRFPRSTRFSLVLALLFVFVMSVQAFAATPINMWIASQPATVNQWVPTFVEAFNKANPGIELTVDIYPSVSTIRNKFIVALAAGTGPDIFYDASNLIMKWAYSGAAIPLDKYMSTWSGKKDLIPDILRNVVYQGKIYALPFSFWPTGDAYNLDMIAEAGLVEPKNWSDMINAARKLIKTSDAGVVERYGYYKSTTGAGSLEDLELALNQLGTTMLLPEAKTGNINTDLGKQAMQYLTDIASAGMGGNFSMTANMAGGNVAIQHCYGGYDIFNKLVKVAPETKWGFRRYVGPTSGKTMIQINAGNLIITSGSKHPDEAWKVLESFASPDILMSYLIAHGSALPTRLSQVYDNRLKQGEVFKELLGAVVTPMSAVGALHPYFTDIRTAVGNILAQAITGKTAPGQALDEAERLMNVSIAELIAANK